jgi:hypothetical protein
VHVNDIGNVVIAKRRGGTPSLDETRIDGPDHDEDGPQANEVREDDQVVAETRRGRDQHPFDTEFNGRGGESLSRGVVQIVEKLVFCQTEQGEIAAVDNGFELRPNLGEAVLVPSLSVRVALHLSEGDREIERGVECRPGLVLRKLDRGAMEPPRTT